MLLIKFMVDPEETEDKESHTPQKKARSRLGFSLAFRVLFISFIFIILPLIIYSFIVYSHDYHSKLNSVFQEMKLFQDDQVAMISDSENDADNFLNTFISLMTALKHEDKMLSDFELEPILLDFVTKQSLSAIFLVESKPNGDLVCNKSTLALYKGVNFAEFFPKGIIDKKGKQVFMAKDPIFGYSIFIAYRIPDFLDKTTSMAVTSISAEALMNELHQKRTIFDMNISILDHDLEVIATTDEGLIHSQLVPFKEGGDIKRSDLTSLQVPLQQTRSVENGYKYYFSGKKRFCVLAKIPQTNAYLLTSAPSDVLLSKMFEGFYHLGVFLICVLTFGGIAAFLFTLRISKPLKRLGSVMSAVGEGKLDERYTRDAMGFEINFLGERFNQMIVSLISYIEEVKREKASKEALAKELQIGHEIQQSILPPRDTKFPGIDVAVYFEPAKEVAGDFFDWLLKGDQVLITIADGVGKGVSSALYSFDLRSILRSYATTQEHLRDVVIKTNQLFCDDTKESGNFVTAFLALYDSKKQSLQYVNCGHNYPFIKRATGEVIKLETKGIAFGVDNISEVDVKMIDLHPGDFIVMYTDGITEAQNKQEELYTEERLVEIIKASNFDNPEALSNEIISGVEEFTGGADQYDDMTMIVIKIK